MSANSLMRLNCLSSFIALVYILAAPHIELTEVVCDGVLDFVVIIELYADKVFAVFEFGVVNNLQPMAFRHEPAVRITQLDGVPSAVSVVGSDDVFDVSLGFCEL